MLLERQATLPHFSEGERLMVLVSADGQARFLIRGKGEAPECRLFEAGVERSLGRLAPLSESVAYDMFSDGRLVIARFPPKRDDKTTRNAAILNTDGSIGAEFHIGYGYEDIQIGPDGRIWVSYFDEGVYSGGEIPSNGLVAFDETGALVWENQQRSLIDDCYALNVSDEGVWFCAYSDFDLCRVKPDGIVSALRNPVKGAGAFAIEGDRVLFSCQYDEPPETVHLAKLSGGAVRKPTVLALLTKENVKITRHSVRMRGGFVHVFEGGGWYRGHLRDI